MKRTKFFLVISVCLLLASVLVLNAQDDGNEQSTGITIENEWIKAVVEIESGDFSAFRISEFYNKVKAPDTNLVEANRWFDIGASISGYETGSHYAIPMNATVVSQTENSLVLISKRFNQKNGKKPFPLQTTVTYELLKNKLIIRYEFFAKKQIVLESGIEFDTFINHNDFKEGLVYNWARSTPEIPVGEFNRSEKPVFTAQYRPGHHYRFKGASGSIDIYSPNGAMDQNNLSREGVRWILFSELIPTARLTDGQPAEQVLLKGKKYTKTIVVVAGFGEGKLNTEADPCSMFSPFPDGATGAIVQLIDDIPSVTVTAGGEHWNIPTNTKDNPVPFADQMINFLKKFPTMKVNMQIIFDSMIGINQADADQRLIGNEVVQPDNGATANELWMFHNPTKRVSTSPEEYKAWLMDIAEGKEEYHQQIEFGNSSYHYLRLDNIAFKEFENDPENSIPDITQNYTEKTFEAIQADSIASGLMMPVVFRPPGSIYNQVTLETAAKFGTTVMEVGRRPRLPHLVQTVDGQILALYHNWNPTLEGATKKDIYDFVLKGWPVISVGTYFDATNARTKLLYKAFKLVNRKLPDAAYLFATEYASFFKEKDKMTWIRDEYDEETGTVTVTFTGKSSHGQTLLVLIPSWVKNLRANPTVDGLEFEGYKIRGNILVLPLPELKGAANKTHTVQAILGG